MSSSVNTDAVRASIAILDKLFEESDDCHDKRGYTLTQSRRVLAGLKVLRGELSKAITTRENEILENLPPLTRQAAASKLALEYFSESR